MRPWTRPLDTVTISKNLLSRWFGPRCQWMFPLYKWLIFRRFYFHWICRLILFNRTISSLDLNPGNDRGGSTAHSLWPGTHWCSEWAPQGRDECQPTYLRFYYFTILRHQSQSQRGLMICSVFQYVKYTSSSSSVTCNLRHLSFQFVTIIWQTKINIKFTLKSTYFPTTYHWRQN